MLIPIRCFTCGSLVADKYEAFKKRLAEGKNVKAVFEELGIKRFCCMRMLLTNVDIIDQVLPYQEALYRRKLEFEST